MYSGLAAYTLATHSEICLPRTTRMTKENTLVSLLAKNKLPQSTYLKLCAHIRIRERYLVPEASSITTLHAPDLV